MFKGIGDFIGQASKMREEMQKVQMSLEKRTTEVETGGGMVKVTANGKQQILSVVIDPEMLKRNDVQMLQDLVVSGVNQALKESQEMVKEEMGRLTGDLGPLGAMLRGMQ